MRTLNRAAAEALMSLPADAIHACTDVTGFGLIGHATELAVASGVTLEIAAGKVPLLTGVRDIARQNRSGGMTSNEEHFAAGVSVAAGVDEEMLALLYDPQTSGGLLIAAGADWSDHLVSLMEKGGVRAWAIGRARSQNGGVRVRIMV
jgi:selenide,water dikinase